MHPLSTLYRRASRDSCAWNRRASRSDGHCGRAGRGCHQQASDRRSARASARPAVAKSGSSSAPDSDPRKSPRNRGARGSRGRSHRPIVDDQDIDAAEPRELKLRKLPSTRAIARSTKQRNRARVLPSAAYPSRHAFCARRTPWLLPTPVGPSDENLLAEADQADSRKDEDVLVRSDPGGLLSQGPDNALIEAASGAIVNLFDAGVRRAQLRIFQAS